MIGLAPQCCAEIFLRQIKIPQAGIGGGPAGVVARLIGVQLDSGAEVRRSLLKSPKIILEIGPISEGVSMSGIQL